MIAALAASYHQNQSIAVFCCPMACCCGMMYPARGQREAGVRWRSASRSARSPCRIHQPARVFFLCAREVHQTFGPGDAL